VRSCLIDGEVVCCDERGLAMFHVFADRTRPTPFSTPSTCWSWTVPTCGASRSKFARTLASILRKARVGLRLNEHLEHDCGLTIFQHACRLGCGQVSKRLG
jgi:hypothetical protein